MTAALDLHSIGVLSISLLPTTAFERSFDSFLNLDRRRKQPAFWTAPLLCSPPLIAFYTQCRCCQPDMFISREVCWIPICFRQAESQQHTAASRAFVSFVSHPQQDLFKALKSNNNAPPCFQDDLRITTTKHTQQVYVPPHVITKHNILSSKTLPHRHPPFRTQIDSSPSASVHHLAFAPYFSELCPRSGAFTTGHCTHTLVASILCRPGHVLVVWFGHE
jgi:hypothetical protein